MRCRDYMTRSALRRFDGPIGSHERGYFDPVTAIATSAGVQAIGGGLQYEAQRKATKAATAAEQARMAQVAPYVQAGAGALPEFRANIAEQPTYADTVANIGADPGFRFEMQQGQNAIQGAAATRGLLRSGRTLKDLAAYAQNLAQARAGDAFTRELNAFNNKQNQLLQLVNAGQSAAGGASSLGNLALAQGQNKADLIGNIANTATSTGHNLMLLNLLKGQGGGVPWAGGGGAAANAAVGGLV